MVLVVEQAFLFLLVFVLGVSELFVLGVEHSHLMGDGNMATRRNHQLSESIDEEFCREDKTMM